MLVIITIRRKNNDRHIFCHLSQSSESLLYIWATFITNQCALCNALLSIFYQISLWSNHNWAFICFMAGLQGIASLTYISNGRGLFSLISKLQAASPRLKWQNMLAVVGAQKVLCHFFLELRKSFKEESCSSGGRLKSVDSVTAVTEPWQLLLSSVCLDSATSRPAEKVC